MNRRDFIKGATILGSTFALPVLSSEGQVRLTTVISGIHPNTSGSHMKAVLDAFMAAGLPVTCVLETKSPNGTSLVQNSEISTLIKYYLRKYPGLVEVAGFVENLATQSPYFQSRSTFHVKSHLQSIFGSVQGDEVSKFQLQSIACTETPDMIGPTGVRSAGIRNVLVIPRTSKPVIPELWDGDILRLIGGSNDSTLSAGFPSNFTNDTVNHVSILNAPDITSLSTDTVSNIAAWYAQSAIEMEGTGRISNQRLKDLQLRDNYRYKRLVAAHIFSPTSEGKFDENVITRLKKDLISNEIPFSTGLNIFASNGKASLRGYWIPDAISPNTNTSYEGTQPEHLFRFECDALGHNVYRNTENSKSEGIGVVLKSVKHGIQGVDQCGNLVIPLFSSATFFDANSAEQIPQLGDFVIGIYPETIQSDAQRSNILHHLVSIKSDSISKLTTIKDLTNSIRPKSNLISVYRKTEAAALVASPKPQKSKETEKKLLLDDARTAWSYFERFTNHKTGLCPATINTSRGVLRIHNVVTMWDVGSHINALIAAVDLKLISDKKFQRDIARILRNIRGRRSNNRLLPQGWIKTDKQKWGDANFDGCDAGRLLASLSNLHKHRLSTGTEAKLVKSWDLDKIIIKGIIHSVKGGVLKPANLSHCGHYSALAFRYWGLKALSPYEMNKYSSETDRKIALLAAVSSIGPVGAEPLLMEAMDFGLTKDTQFLADVLFTAQLEEFEKSGDMICVSEGPIDKFPWFTYQGLQVDENIKKWRIKGVNDDTIFSTEAAQIAYRVISCKAAYLWNTSRPHNFSTALSSTITFFSTSRSIR